MQRRGNPLGLILILEGEFRFYAPKYVITGLVIAARLAQNDRVAKGNPLPRGARVAYVVSAFGSRRRRCHICKLLGGGGATR